MDTDRPHPSSGDRMPVGASRPAAPAPDDRSLGELFSELVSEVSTLVRKETELAKAELTEKATVAGRNIGALAAGGLIAYAGLLVLLAALVMGLDEFMATGLAALLVGAVVTLIGGVLVMQGLNALKNMDLTPQQTIESLKEDKEWIQEQTK